MCFAVKIFRSEGLKRRCKSMDSRFFALVLIWTHKRILNKNLYNFFFYKINSCKHTSICAGPTDGNLDVNKICCQRAKPFNLLSTQQSQKRWRGLASLYWWPCGPATAQGFSHLQSGSCRWAASALHRPVRRYWHLNFLNNRSSRLTPLLGWKPFTI